MVRPRWYRKAIRRQGTSLWRRQGRDQHFFSSVTIQNRELRMVTLHGGRGPVVGGGVVAPMRTESSIEKFPTAVRIGRSALIRPAKVSGSCSLQRRHS